MPVVCVKSAQIAARYPLLFGMNVVSSGAIDLGLNTNRSGTNRVPLPKRKARSVSFTHQTTRSSVIRPHCIAI